MSKSTVFTPEVLAVKCRACSAEPGQPCVVGATGAKATKAHNVRVADGRENAWAGFNALTEWSDHFAPTRGDDPDASRAERAIYDPAFKNRALDIMLAA